MSSIFDRVNGGRERFLADEATGRTAKLDSISDALVTIDYPHKEIHGGSAFVTGVVTTSGTALNIAFKTPAGTKRAHMEFEFVSESKAHLEVLEGATWTTNTGTVVAPVNAHRGSATTSVLLEDKTATPAFTAGGVLTNVTVADAGTAVFSQYVFASKQTGAEGGSRHEGILASDETYVIRLTSDDGAKGLQIRLSWYEHTDTVSE